MLRLVCTTLAGNEVKMEGSVEGPHSRVFTWMLPAMLIILPAQNLNAQPDERAEFFESRIRPLLLDKCIECHGPTKQEHDVRLDRREDVLNGRASELPLITPNDPAASRLMQVLAHSSDDIAMPPAGKLNEQQFADMQRWIEQGAYWPENANLEADAMRKLQQWREHWAFQPPKMPDVSTATSGVSPVDHFVASALDSLHLQRSPEAPREVLIRRLSFAIIGLPPESADLLAARSAQDEASWQAWKNDYIDRLLASPHFGERWGRYWLDVARYADTKGYVFQEDREYPEAWRFREWVINSLNADMPYDEFLRRQLSADRLPGSDDAAQLAAMGYLTLGRRFLNNPHDVIDDRIDVVSRGMLGLTVSCARCHDHKFDPIPTADYYSLYGVFASSDEPKDAPSPLRLVDKPKPITPVIFLRGSPGNRGDPVPRRFLTALSSADARPFNDGSGRLELANAIASRSNPLTARVAVNRVWMHLFGRGLVDTPSDFGVRTPPPSHPELLDWLAVDFMDHNWSLKHTIRTIVSSESWQQSSARREDAELADPENRLLSRMNRQRLNFEAQRDAMLFVSGRMDRTIGGPSVDIAADTNAVRRSIYARIDRQNLPGMFRTFDLASPDAHSPRRYETTVPQQSLYQLNNPFVMTRASETADRSTVAGNDATNQREQVSRLFDIVLQRTPTSQELAESELFLSELTHLQSHHVTNSGWSYGYGSIDETRNIVDRFTLLPMLRDGKWQGGAEFPDAVLGWTMLNQRGGHPGGTRELCAIRRWTANADCRVTVNAVLNHKQEKGDGVRMRTVAPLGVVVHDITANSTTAIAPASTLELRSGESLDFVVDCRTDEAHDGFRLQVIISQSVNGRVQRVWNSENDFEEGASSSKLPPMAQLAQTLMMTNEFSFVD